jgi:predicted site-specific integrase-resolvase
MSNDLGRPVLEKGRVYSLAEVSAILGVHTTSVRRWVRGGLLPAKGIGRLYFTAATRCLGTLTRSKILLYNEVH